MRKVYHTSICLMLILIQYEVYSVDTSAVRYLPLAVGNVYVYNWMYTGPPGYGGVTRSIISKDTIVNAKRYFVSNFPALPLYPQFVRLDSLTGNVYGYSPGSGCTFHPNEVLLDSLCSRKLDTFNICNLDRRVCTDTGIANIFGLQFKRKNFTPYMALSASSRYYARNIGFYFLNEGDPYATIYSLKGCVLNGIVYGDTTLPVGIIPISNEIPNNFSLSQNYPNPFNPATKIRFSLPFPSKGGVKLEVYDVLGRLVVSLIPPLWGGQEGLKPGTYEVEFDGTNYPSGVYFYRLISESYSEIRKMVLLK